MKDFYTVFTETAKIFFFFKQNYFTTPQKQFWEGHIECYHVGLY